MDISSKSPYLSKVFFVPDLGTAIFSENLISGIFLCGWEDHEKLF